MLPPYNARERASVFGTQDALENGIHLGTERRPARLVTAARVVGILAGTALILPMLSPLIPMDDAAWGPLVSYTPEVANASTAETIPPPLMPDEPVAFEAIPDEVTDTPTHPPLALPPTSEDLEDPAVAARVAVDAVFARQSKTLAEATARYTLHTKRPPPPNYDRWFQFAQEHQCLIDEYEQVHRDFKPFYQLAETHPQFFQWMIDVESKLLDAAPAEISVVEIRDGEAFISGGTAYATWPETFSKFSTLLPDMTFVINGRDEPRVAFNFRSRTAETQAFERTDMQPFHIEPRPTADFFRNQDGCFVPMEADGIMRGVNDEHSFLLASAKPGYTTDLYPMLSMAKVSPCFSDILFPTEYYYDRSWWSGKYEHPDDVAWEDKKPQIYWRGKSTGGKIIGENYHHFMRFKLADLGAGYPDLLDVKLTQVDDLACGDGCDSDAIAREYNITGDWAAREDVYSYKYAVDVDGETFSGRFLGLLRSGSLVFKATIFEEYFNGWLKPFEHYIPVKADLSDLVQQVKWANENPVEARLIQLRGLEAARRLVTDEQSDCYFSAVLLEWAQLQEIARKAKEVVEEEVVAQVEEVEVGME
ncbi:glycosyl transferase family 90-domain-containing protein [Roridomyces roridus]|uniref:Glycosyl transferase family 90-domain-containing protein n=1 Tax=Roridomyces roridus TaxID=1738132 RepID=A0AAD7BD64_9AGAR|nr:glycosyl transferase family 90-domain-containing protein [Roridomyces roridus]